MYTMTPPGLTNLRSKMGYWIPKKTIARSWHPPPSPQSRRRDHVQMRNWIGDPNNNLPLPWQGVGQE